MRFIITGGTGLIGRALYNDLARDSHEVILLSRYPEKYKDIPESVQIIEWDGMTENGWIEFAEGSHALINLAGENIVGSHWTKEHERRILESRVNAGSAIVRAVERLRKKPAVVIQSSGVGFYGSRNNELLSESAGPGDDFFARIAIAWETSSHRIESLNVRRAIIRSGMVLSSEGGAFERLQRVFKRFIGGSIGSGRQWLSWIHIDDEVRAIRYLIENEKMKGPFNLVAPNPVQNGDFSKILGRVLKRPSLLRAPEFLLRMKFGGLADALLASQRAVPKKLTESGFTFKFKDLEAALLDLIGKLE